MKWSQLKLRVESCFAESVRGRVELHVARYHKAHDEMGRGWITMDGVEIWNMCQFVSAVAVGTEVERLREVRGCKDYQDPHQREGYYDAIEEAELDVHRKGIFSRGEFTFSLSRYLNLSMGEIIKSTNPIVRGVGMLDRRFGKRRIVGADVREENPFVQRLFAIRCEVEGIIAGGGG